MKSWWPPILIVMITAIQASQVDASATTHSEPLSSAELGDAGPFHSVRFENGITFGEPLGRFSLSMRFRMQNRADFMDDVERGFRHEWQVRRARLRFNGHVVDPRLRYLLQLSFSNRDQDLSDTERPNVLRDAMILYQVSDRLQVGFGQGKLPGNRQRVVSSGDLQFIDRSIVNAAFNIDRDFGFQGNYQIPMQGQQVLELKGSITSGEGRNRAVVSDGRVFAVGRVEWLPFGEFSRNGDYFESDLAREPGSKLSFGYTYASLAGSARANGTVGKIFFKEEPGLLRRSQVVQMLDFLWKRQGMSLYVEYATRAAANPYFDQNFTLLVGSGLNVQVGQMIWDKSEVGARYSTVQPTGDSLLVHSPQEQWTFVFNHFLNGHRVKLQSEVGWTVTRDQFVRLQMELGI